MTKLRARFPGPQSTGCTGPVSGHIGGPYHQQRKAGKRKYSRAVCLFTLSEVPRVIFAAHQRCSLGCSVYLRCPPISVSEGVEMNSTSQNVKNRSRLDLSKLSTFSGPLVDDVIVPEITNTSSYKKSNRTPMKMLIDHEMSKEVEFRHSPPNLVAKLMGLDALPQPEPKLATKRSLSKGHSRSHSDIPVSEWEQQQRFSHYGDPNEYKDIHEVWEQQPQRFMTANDKKMALVRQKFLEAKRLSMDGRLRQSKQFQDALEVLSSNRDLFLKCLQEPSSVFAQQFYSLDSVPPPETKRITLLRPSKNTDDFYFAGDKDGKRELEKSIFAYTRNSPPKNHESPTQPIRIVVLKPSLDKILDNSKGISSPQSQSAIIHGEVFLGDVEDNENRESRLVAKAITNQMRKKLGSHHRDETIINSAVESSFGESEIEYRSGDLSESEATSPVSRHSWEYVNNRQRSPFSSSSFSRASYSLESSVCREAKKRLSERWALMASNGSCQEQRQIHRSSSTLGEMLALCESRHEKNEIVVPPLRGSVSNEKLKDSNNILESGRREVQDVSNNSPRNLTRSKSVPVSSSQFGSRLDVEAPVVPNKGKLEVVPKEGAKARSGNSSFKGKVSSLFFSRSKKGNKDKPIGPGTGDESGSSFLEEISSDGSGIHLEEVPEQSSPGLLELSNKASSSCVISPETKFSVPKPAASGNIGENKDQPSPISVLDPPFDLHERPSKVFPRYVEPDPHGYELSSRPLSSNLIDKSPSICSIARTLLWDDSSLDTASSHPRKEPLTTTQATTNDEGQEWYSFARTLLSMTGLESEAHHGSFFASWHSPESPLDPSLRDTYINLKHNTNEARQRQKRSMQKLVFDCLNVVLVELVGHRLSPGQLADEVWARMNCWFSGECVSGDENGLVVERVVRNEVAGKGWVENLRFERDILGKEIEGVLLEMLLEEAVIELDR
ncbi:Protein of unknown function (DUF3741 [Striga hermonthica]|uniref:DUF4378 domain-containing protein n=1 Tax=Striga hermonthica TaxID=68872 RepID=A0A9N7N6U7_STRHE|nr:Protein of unknown function (DUF3741 [Striga hermonthica]